MTIPTSIEAACLQALSRFDFPKAATIYKMLGWEWQGVVPDEAKIQVQAQRLCASLCEPGGKPRSVSTGGLIASLSHVECGWEVSINFIAVGGASNDFQEVD